MTFEYWDSLSIDERLEVVKQAKKVHEANGRKTCFWCGSSLDGRYGYTLNPIDPREICEYACKRRRFFDNPIEDE